MAQFATNSGLIRILELIEDDVSHIGVQSGAAPTVNSSVLNTEYARKGVTDPLIDGYTFVVDAFFDTADGNGTITGWGVFGDGATDTLATGTLIAATTADIVKDDTQSLTLSAEITLRRAT
jgi:hypothetical protein